MDVHIGVRSTATGVADKRHMRQDVQAPGVGQAVHDVAPFVALVVAEYRD